MSKLFKGRIENWNTHPFKDCGLGLEFKIRGTPHGHPDFVDWIVTSMVVKVNDSKEPWTVETLNSIYELGTPENHYEHYYGVNKPID